MGYDAYRPITTETRLSLPLNGSIYTTTRSVAAEKPTPQVGASMETELGPTFKRSLIVSANVVPSGNGEKQQIVHALIPAEADQLSSNWEYSTCSIGGRQFPSVQRTVILVASTGYVPEGESMDVVAYATPTIGSAMPVEEGSIFADKGYILADRQVARSGMQLEPVFRVERRNYIVRSVRKNIGTDPLNGKPLWSETTLYHTGEVVSGTAVTEGGDDLTIDQLFEAPTHPFWGTQANATRRTGTRLSCAWFSVTTELIVAGTVSGSGDSAVVAIDSHTGQERFFWPPVLDGAIDFMNWARRDGGVDIFPRYKFKPDGYYGPCKSTTTRTWSRAPFTDIAIEQFLPTPVHYSSPFFNINMPSCLHPEITCVCDIGSGDPVYAVNSGSSRTVPATNYTTWPTTMRAYDGQVPFRGGYLRTTKIISKPA